MTEALAEVDEQTTEAPEAAKEIVFVDDFQKAAYDQISGLIHKRNGLAGTANAANGNRLDLTEQITEEDTDPEIVAAREARDNAIERLSALVGPKVDAILADASEGLSGLEAEIKNLDGQIRPGLTYFKKVYGDDAAEFLPKITRLKGISISNAGTSRRVRGFNLTVNLDGQIQEFENFASAAKWLDQDTSMLQEAFFSAAGSPEKLKDAPDKVQFTVTFNEVDEDENEVSRTATCTAYRPEGTDED